MDVDVDGLTAPARMSALCCASIGRSACLVDGHTLRGRPSSEPSDPAGASSPCRCWSAAREACRSVCLLDLVDAGVGAAENAWAARACDGLDGGRSSGCRAVPWSRNPGQAADRRSRRLVWVGPSLALAVVGAVLWFL